MEYGNTDMINNFVAEPQKLQNEPDANEMRLVRTGMTHFDKHKMINLLIGRELGREVFG